MAQGHGIKPATAPCPTGGGADFIAFDRQMLAKLVKQLGRERPRTHPCGVGFGDTQYIIKKQRPEAGACGSAARRGIG